MHSRRRRAQVRLSLCAKFERATQNRHYPRQMAKSVEAARGHAAILRRQRRAIAHRSLNSDAECDKFCRLVFLMQSQS